MNYNIIFVLLRRIKLGEMDWENNVYRPPTSTIISDITMLGHRYNGYYNNATERHA